MVSSNRKEQMFGNGGCNISGSGIENLKKALKEHTEIPDELIEEVARKIENSGGKSAHVMEIKGLPVGQILTDFLEFLNKKAEESVPEEVKQRGKMLDGISEDICKACLDIADKGTDLPDLSDEEKIRVKLEALTNTVCKVLVALEDNKEFQRKMILPALLKIKTVGL